jgi:hypothetical protein
MSNLNKLLFRIGVLVFVWVELFAELLVRVSNVFVGSGFMD